MARLQDVQLTGRVHPAMSGEIAARPSTIIDVTDYLSRISAMMLAQDERIQFPVIVSKAGSNNSYIVLWKSEKARAYSSVPPGLIVPAGKPKNPDACIRPRVNNDMPAYFCRFSGSCFGC